MNLPRDKLQAEVRVGFDRPLDLRERGRLLEMLSQFRQENPEVLPEEVTRRYRHWNDNFLETEITFLMSEPSCVELRLELAGPKAFWREALSHWVRKVESELKTEVKIQPSELAAVG
jgi:hypothetical protein